MIFLSLNNEPGVSVKYLRSVNGMLPVLSPKSRGSWLKHELPTTMLKIRQNRKIIFNSAYNSNESNPGFRPDHEHAQPREARSRWQAWKASPGERVIA